MDLLNDLLALLRARPQIVRLERVDQTKPVMSASWAVLYAGKRRSGQGYKDVCEVAAFGSPQYTAKSESSLAALGEVLMSVLLASDHLVGDMAREDIDGFPVLRVEVAEA